MCVWCLQRSNYCIKIPVFRGVMSHQLARWLAPLKGTDYLCLPSTLLWNVGNHVSSDIASYSRKPQTSVTLLWTCQALHVCVILKGSADICACLLHKWNVLHPHSMSVALCVGGSSEGHVYLAVREPLNVVVVPEQFQFQRGDSVSLSCYATGTPKPAFVWKKDGLVLKQV
jgi:hypothetical protein